MSETTTPAAPATAPAKPPLDPIIDYEAFASEIRYDRTDLDTAFQQQAGLYAYYAERHQKAMRQSDGKEHMLRFIEATIAKELRDAAAASGEKITEKAIEQVIILDRRFVMAKMAANDARGIAELAKGCLEALKQRRDMLIQSGVTMREERKGDMSMRAPSAAAAWRDHLASA